MIKLNLQYFGGRGSAGSGGGGSGVVVSKYTGDEITLEMAIDSWQRNATGIKAASQGLTHEQDFRKVGLNDEAKAQQLQNYVKGHTEKRTIYRGIGNISDEQYKNYTTKGATIQERGLSSWSTEEAVAVQRGSYKGGNSVTFVKTSPTKNTRALGKPYSTGEKEVIGSNIKGTVTRVKKGKYTTLVYMN